MNDREEDLDLIEPAGMGWGMNEYGIRPLLPEALDRSFAAMNGSVIDDPEDSLRGAIGVPSIYSSASPWVGSQPCGAKYPGFCADSKGV